MPTIICGRVLTISREDDPLPHGFLVHGCGSLYKCALWMERLSQAPERLDGSLHWYMFQCYVLSMFLFVLFCLLCLAPFCINIYPKGCMGFIRTSPKLLLAVSTQTTVGPLHEGVLKTRLTMGRSFLPLFCLSHITYDTRPHRA